VDAHADGKVMGDDFDPLALKPEERKAYKYEGPEIIYVFWAKHGPCQTPASNAAPSPISRM
jgi:putative DNA methylase